MRPASCSSAAPSATNTSVMEARCSAKLLSLFTGRVGSYIPGCGRRLVAISRMPSSTDLARSAAPEIFLPSATRRMPEARSRNGPQATYRVNSSGPWVEAYCARLRQTALARNLRSFSRWASYKHHAMLVCFLRPFRVTDSNSFWRMRFNSCVNSPNGGPANWPHHRVQPARVGGGFFARTVCGDPTVDVSSGGLCWADEPRSC